MKTSFILRSPEFDVELRTIVGSDGEMLRQWKNAHRFAFFYQELISSEQQAVWLKGYLERADDYLFVVSSQGVAIGCMGFRLIEGRADVYNVILGRPEMSGQGLMSQALRLMCSYILAHYSQQVQAKVLSSNPAIEWYRKNGFREHMIYDTYAEMELDLDQFLACSFERVQSPDRAEKRRDA